MKHRAAPHYHEVAISKFFDGLAPNRLVYQRLHLADIASQGLKGHMSSKALYQMPFPVFTNRFKLFDKLVHYSGLWLFEGANSSG